MPSAVRPSAIINSYWKVKLAIVSVTAAEPLILIGLPSTPTKLWETKDFNVVFGANLSHTLQLIKDTPAPVSTKNDIDELYTVPFKK